MSGLSKGDGSIGLLPHSFPGGPGGVATAEGKAIDVGTGITVPGEAQRIRLAVIPRHAARTRQARERRSGKKEATVSDSGNERLDVGFFHWTRQP